MARPLKSTDLSHRSYFGLSKIVFDEYKPKMNLRRDAVLGGLMISGMKVCALWPLVLYIIGVILRFQLIIELMSENIANLFIFTVTYIFILVRKL